MSETITIDKVKDFTGLSNQDRESCKLVRLGRYIDDIAGILVHRWPRLVLVEVHKDNEHFTVNDGSIYTKDLRTLVWLPRKYHKVALEIGEETVTLAKRSLSNHLFLRMIDTGNGCTSILDWAMADNAMLQEVNLGKSVAVLSPSTFYNTPALKRVSIHEENKVLSTTSNAIFANDGQLLVAVYGAPSMEEIDLTENCTEVCRYADGTNTTLVVKEGRVILA